MTWSKRYTPPNKTLWQGRTDIPPQSCFFQLIRLLDLNQPIPASQSTISFGLVGFCCDEGIRRNQGRIGAAQGPAAIREVLAKMPMSKQPILYDVGDITCSDGNLEEAQIALGDIVALLLQHHIIPIVIGGGHELAYGHYLGLHKTLTHEQLGIINFDAHFDMRPLLSDAKGSSGTPFLQIAKLHTVFKRRFDYNCIGIQPAGNMASLFDTAKKYRTHFLWAEDIHCGEPSKRKAFIDRLIKENQKIYLSLCLDVFAAPYAPGVSAPQTFGLTPWQVLPLVRQLAASGKIISYDIAELSPKYDIDQRTAKLAAHFVYEIIHHHGVNASSC